VAQLYPRALDYSGKFWEKLIADFSWSDTDRIENRITINYSIVACLIVSAVMFPLSSCQATILIFLAILCLATVRGHTDTQADARDLRSTPLRLDQMPSFLHHIS
jgi:hypothetical protein